MLIKRILCITNCRTPQKAYQCLVGRRRWAPVMVPRECPVHIFAQGLARNSRAYHLQLVAEYSADSGVVRDQQCRRNRRLSRYSTQQNYPEIIGVGVVRVVQEYVNPELQSMQRIHRFPWLTIHRFRYQ